MRAAASSALVGLLLACTSSAPEPGHPPPTAEPPKSSPDPAPRDPAASSDTGSCEDKRAAYVAARAALNTCETDSDCSEIWPGLCPLGPFYIHRDATIDGVLALEAEIYAECSTPECEPPNELGIAHCDVGVCKPGRSSAEKEAKAARTKQIKHMSCWDYRETWLEPVGGATATASNVHNGVTPHLAIAPAKPGTLVIDVDWPRACTSCRLLISEHNSGMAQLVTGTVTTTETERNGEPTRHEQIEVRVTPGPYHMIAMADADADYTLRAELLDAGGNPSQVTRHGVGWQRMCEG